MICDNNMSDGFNAVTNPFKNGIGCAQAAVVCLAYLYLHYCYKFGLRTRVKKQENKTENDGMIFFQFLQQR